MIEELRRIRRRKPLGRTLLEVVAWVALVVGVGGTLGLLAKLWLTGGAA